MEKSATYVGWISVISNLLLTIMKIVVGLLAQSQVLIADGIHNAGDVVASVAAVFSMRVSKQPADEEHPYGHGKAEVVAAGIVAIIMAIAALFIAYESILSLFEPAPPAHMIAAFVAAVSLVWKLVLYVYTMRIGKQTNSKGLIATAYDHLADVYASLAAIIGIVLALLGQAYSIPYTAYGDPIAGIVVSVLVFKLALTMGKESLDVLMEKNVSSEKLEGYESIVLSVPNVKRIDRLRAREHGHYILLDVRVGVPGDISVQEGHDISREIRNTIMRLDDEVEEVLVHLNPWYEKD